MFSFWFFSIFWSINKCWWEGMVRLHFVCIYPLVEAFFLVGRMKGFPLLNQYGWVLHFLCIFGFRVVLCIVCLSCFMPTEKYISCFTQFALSCTFPLICFQLTDLWPFLSSTCKMVCKEILLLAPWRNSPGPLLFFQFHLPWILLRYIRTHLLLN